MTFLNHTVPNSFFSCLKNSSVITQHARSLLFDKNRVNQIAVTNDKNPTSVFYNFVNCAKNMNMKVKTDHYEENGKEIHHVDTKFRNSKMPRNWSRNGLSSVYPHTEDSYDEEGVDWLLFMFLENNVNLPLKMVCGNHSLRYLLGIHENQKQRNFEKHIFSQHPEYWKYWSSLNCQSRMTALCSEQFTNVSGPNNEKKIFCNSSFLKLQNDVLRYNWNCNEDRILATKENEWLYRIINETVLYSYEKDYIAISEPNILLYIPNHLFFHGRDAYQSDCRNSDFVERRIFLRSKLIG